MGGFIQPQGQADFLGGGMAKWGLEGEGHLPSEGAVQPAGHRPVCGRAWQMSRVTTQTGGRVRALEA